jgi:hypothetical protein
MFVRMLYIAWYYSRIEVYIETTSCLFYGLLEFSFDSIVSSLHNSSHHVQNEEGADTSSDSSCAEVDARYVFSS